MNCGKCFNNRNEVNYAESVLKIQMILSRVWIRHGKQSDYKMQIGEMMKVITIEELERVDPSTCCIIDIRPEDQYRRGTFPGAFNIPVEQFDERKK